jgi:hypothetical protein
LRGIEITSERNGVGGQSLTVESSKLAYVGKHVDCGGAVLEGHKHTSLDQVGGQLRVPIEPLNRHLLHIYVRRRGRDKRTKWEERGCEKWKYLEGNREFIPSSNFVVVDVIGDLFGLHVEVHGRGGVDTCAIEETS